MVDHIQLFQPRGYHGKEARRDLCQRRLEQIQEWIDFYGFDPSDLFDDEPLLKWAQEHANELEAR